MHNTIMESCNTHSWHTTGDGLVGAVLQLSALNYKQILQLLRLLLFAVKTLALFYASIEHVSQGDVAYF